jgi:hypothetical protein
MRIITVSKWSKNTTLQSSGSKSKPFRNQELCLLSASVDLLLGFLFDPEGRGDMFLQDLEICITTTRPNT